MTMIERLINIINRSMDDPFFWIANILFVASVCYIVYNMWNRKEN